MTVLGQSTYYYHLRTGEETGTERFSDLLRVIWYQRQDGNQAVRLHSPCFEPSLFKLQNTHSLNDLADLPGTSSGEMLVGVVYKDTCTRMSVKGKSGTALNSHQ